MAEGFNQPIPGPEGEHDLVLMRITDFQGQVIRLTAGQWRHITDAHPDMLGMESAVRETLEDPEEVRNPEMIQIQCNSTTCATPSPLHQVK
jgi:hypothetical protein